MIITIDGPAGTGKSTIASRIAKKLDFMKLDTGALYRAVSAGCLAFHIDPTNWIELEQFLKEHPLSVDLQASLLEYNIGGIDVTHSIRSHEVNEIVSFVASCPAIRSALLPLQREMGKKQNLVSEGRDMGTTVFPDADFKFYLTASPKVRAQRRYEEMKEKGQLNAGMTPEIIQKQIESRDSIDSSRETSPLTKAQDAIEIDTSSLSIDEVVTEVLHHLKVNTEL